MKAIYSFACLSGRQVVLVSLLFMGLTAFAQNQPLEDVIYLKNGSIVRGQIMEQVPGEQLRIQIQGGSEFVYRMDEIEKIAKELSQNTEQFAQPKKDIYIKQKGYKGITEIGLMSGSTTFEGQNNVNFALNLQTIHGYQFFPQLYVAAGLALDVYPTYDQVFSPIFFSTGGEILKKRVSPTWFANVGYAPEWTAVDDSTLKHNGGLMMQYGAGIKINTRSKVGVVLNVSYKMQKSSMKRTFPWTEDYYQTLHRKYQRVVVSAGISF